MNLAEAYDPIRALRAAWKLVMRAPLPLILGGIALSLVDNNLQIWSGSDDHGRWHLRHAFGEFFVAASCCALVGFFISCWLSVGLANSVERAALTGSARFGDLFDTKHRFFDMVLVRVMVFLLWLASFVPFVFLFLCGWFAKTQMHLAEGAITLLVLLACLVYLPVFLYVVIGISLSHLGVAIEGLDPTRAVRRSWGIARGNRSRLFVYWLALVVFTLLGICLCCVGVLFTGALMQVALNESYLALVKPEDYARSWLATGSLSPLDPPAPATLG